MRQSPSVPAGMQLFRRSTLMRAKVPWLLVLLSILFSLGSLNAQTASVYYVRAGATGGNNGADWSNAYTSLPSTLVRGATYYIATGTYGSYDFTTPESGTAWITIKKATVANHGTSTGWSDAYGTGQANLGQLSFNSANCGYVEVNGQEEYGFKRTFGDAGKGVDWGAGVGHITFKYVEMAGPGGSTSFAYTASTRCFDITPSGGGHSDYVTISHCKLHGADTIIQILNADYLIVEYSDLYDSLSANSAVHANVLYIQNASYGTIRYNKYHHFHAEGIFFTYGGETEWKIYGNVCYDGLEAGSRCIELRQDYTYGTIYIYNNTFASMGYAGVAVRGSVAGGMAANNIFYGASASFDNLSHDYNASNSSLGETHGQTITSNIFMNYAGSDLRLSGATNAGYSSLGSEYNTDMYGRIRGADGTWDIGAYEYSSGDSSVSPKPSPPVNLR